MNENSHTALTYLKSCIGQLNGTTTKDGRAKLDLKLIGETQDSKARELLAKLQLLAYRPEFNDIVEVLQHAYTVDSGPRLVNDTMCVPEVRVGDSLLIDEPIAVLTNHGKDVLIGLDDGFEKFGNGFLTEEQVTALRGCGKYKVASAKDPDPHATVAWTSTPSTMWDEEMGLSYTGFSHIAIALNWLKQLERETFSMGGLDSERGFTVAMDSGLWYLMMFAGIIATDRIMTDRSLYSARLGSSVEKHFTVSHLLQVATSGKASYLMGGQMRTGVPVWLQSLRSMPPVTHIKASELGWKGDAIDIFAHNASMLSDRTEKAKQAHDSSRLKYSQLDAAFTPTAHPLIPLLHDPAGTSVMTASCASSHTIYRMWTALGAMFAHCGTSDLGTYPALNKAVFRHMIRQPMEFGKKTNGAFNLMHKYILGRPRTLRNYPTSVPPYASLVGIPLTDCIRDVEDPHIRICLDVALDSIIGKPTTFDQPTRSWADIKEGILCDPALGPFAVEARAVMDESDSMEIDGTGYNAVVRLAGLLLAIVQPMGCITRQNLAQIGVVGFVTHNQRIMLEGLTSDTVTADARTQLEYYDEIMQLVDVPDAEEFTQGLNSVITTSSGGADKVALHLSSTDLASGAADSAIGDSAFKLKISTNMKAFAIPLQADNILPNVGGGLFAHFKARLAAAAARIAKFAGTLGIRMVAFRKTRSIFMTSTVDQVVFVPFYNACKAWFQREAGAASTHGNIRGNICAPIARSSGAVIADTREHMQSTIDSIMDKTILNMAGDCSGMDQHENEADRNVLIEAVQKRDAEVGAGAYIEGFMMMFGATYLGLLSIILQIRNFHYFSQRVSGAPSHIIEVRNLTSGDLPTTFINTVKSFAMWVYITSWLSKGLGSVIPGAALIRSYTCAQGDDVLIKYIVRARSDEELLHASRYIFLNVAPAGKACNQIVDSGQDALSGGCCAHFLQILIWYGQVVYRPMCLSSETPTVVNPSTLPSFLSKLTKFASRGFNLRLSRMLTTMACSLGSSDSMYDTKVTYDADTVMAPGGLANSLLLGYPSPNSKAFLSAANAGHVISSQRSVIYHPESPNDIGKAIFPSITDVTIKSRVNADPLTRSINESLVKSGALMYVPARMSIESAAVTRSPALADKLPRYSDSLKNGARNALGSVILRDSPGVGMKRNFSKFNRTFGSDHYDSFKNLRVHYAKGTIPCPEALEMTVLSDRRLRTLRVSYSGTRKLVSSGRGYKLMEGDDTLLTLRRQFSGFSGNICYSAYLSIVGVTTAPSPIGSHREAMNAAAPGHRKDLSGKQVLDLLHNLHLDERHDACAIMGYTPVETEALLQKVSQYKLMLTSDELASLSSATDPARCADTTVIDQLMRYVMSDEMTVLYNDMAISERVTIQYVLSCLLYDSVNMCIASSELTASLSADPTVAISNDVCFLPRFEVV